MKTRDLYWTMDGAVSGTVSGAVHWAVSRAARGDPPHPSISNFLAAVGAEPA